MWTAQEVEEEANESAVVVEVAEKNNRYGSEGIFSYVGGGAAEAEENGPRLGPPSSEFHAHLERELNHPQSISSDALISEAKARNL